MHKTKETGLKKQYNLVWYKKYTLFTYKVLLLVHHFNLLLLAWACSLPVAHFWLDCQNQQCHSTYKMSGALTCLWDEWHPFWNHARTSRIFSCMSFFMLSMQENVAQSSTIETAREWHDRNSTRLYNSYKTVQDKLKLYASRARDASEYAPI